MRCLCFLTVTHSAGSSVDLDVLTVLQHAFSTYFRSLLAYKVPVSA